MAEKSPLLHEKNCHERAEADLGCAGLTRAGGSPREGWAWSSGPARFPQKPASPLRAEQTHRRCKAIGPRPLSRRDRKVSRLTFDGASRLLEACRLGAPAQGLTVPCICLPGPDPRARPSPGPVHQPAGPPQSHAPFAPVFQRLVHPVGGEGCRVVENQRHQGHQHSCGHQFLDSHRWLPVPSVCRGESPRPNQLLWPGRTETLLGAARGHHRSFSEGREGPCDSDR